MTKVLDCQSDPIFVVQKSKSDRTTNSNDNESLLELKDAHSHPCLFTNSKSFEILGIELNDSEADLEARRQARIQFELAQFIPLNEKPATLFDKYTQDEIDRFNRLRSKIGAAFDDSRQLIDKADSSVADSQLVSLDQIM